MFVEVAGNVWGKIANDGRLETVGEIQCPHATQEWLASAFSAKRRLSTYQKKAQASEVLVQVKVTASTCLIPC
jgi:hypothetical protein